jgi:hypothetical protein
VEKIYLYLGRRDKSAIKILCIFKGDSIPPTRVPDIKKLNLPSSLEGKVGTTSYQNRFLWEVWIESAESITQLRKNLIKRGYKDVPLAIRPLFSLKEEDRIDVIVPTDMVIKRKTMLQKSLNPN